MAGCSLGPSDGSMSLYNISVIYHYRRIRTTRLYLRLFLHGYTVFISISFPSGRWNGQEKNKKKTNRRTREYSTRLDLGEFMVDGRFFFFFFLRRSSVCPCFFFLTRLCTRRDQRRVRITKRVV